MTSYITEFETKHKPEDYYKKVIDELKCKNVDLGAFNNFNDDLKNGFPFSVKDNICVKNVESTASSKILRTYLPPFNAEVVDRLQKSGFGFLGKTNMDEFGFGSFGINSERIARNPIAPDYVAGGSSSGAAIATALLKYHIAVAESTGGSISAPAAFCGVVGFTPTYGAISRYGLIDYANSLDKIGFMARSATDIRRILDITAGKDKKDPTSSSRHIGGDQKMQLTVIKELMQRVEPKIISSFDKFISKLEDFGYTINYLSMPEIDYALPAYYVISMAEASTNLARYTGFKYGFKVKDFSKRYNDFFTEAREQFGTEAKRRIVLGTFVRSASVKNRYYMKALKVRQLLINKLNLLLKGGFIISPTMPIKTPKIDAIQKLSPVENYAMDILTVPPNLCGFPHVSFPYDYFGEMPLGAQLVTSHFNDHAVLSFVEQWEKSFDYKFKYNIGAL